MLVLVMLHLFNMFTNFYTHGSGFLVLFALLLKLVTSNVTLHYFCQLCKLVQLYDQLFHEMEESTNIS